MDNFFILFKQFLLFFIVATSIGILSFSFALVCRKIKNNNIFFKVSFTKAKPNAKVTIQKIADCRLSEAGTGVQICGYLEGKKLPTISNSSFDISQSK